MLGFDVSVHAFCRLFITSIINDLGVSPEESLASSRYHCVAAQRAYMVLVGNVGNMSVRHVGVVSCRLISSRHSNVADIVTDP